MNDTHEVISAFLDDEPFEASQLVQALSEPGGRELLIDMVALRNVIHAESPLNAQAPPRSRRTMARVLLPAAAVLVALVGGYLVGERRSEPEASTPPAATRVVEAPATWQNLPQGAR